MPTIGTPGNGWICPVPSLTVRKTGPTGRLENRACLSISNTPCSAAPPHLYINSLDHLCIENKSVRFVRKACKVAGWSPGSKNPPVFTGRTGSSPLGLPCRPGLPRRLSWTGLRWAAGHWEIEVWLAVLVQHVPEAVAGRSTAYNLAPREREAALQLTAVL